MILSGKTIKGTKILKETLVEETNESLTFRDTLEECLVKLCRELDIPVPLWLKRIQRNLPAIAGHFSPMSNS